MMGIFFSQWIGYLLKSKEIATNTKEDSLSKIMEHKDLTDAQRKEVKNCYKEFLLKCSHPACNPMNATFQLVKKYRRSISRYL
jgi:hypothetical protein